MASARHIKMTHSCSWPVVYVSASISFLCVRKKPLWFSQEVFYQSPRVLWWGWAAPSSHLRAQILMKIRIFKSSWPFILYLSSKAMLSEWEGEVASLGTHLSKGNSFAKEHSNRLSLIVFHYSLVVCWWRVLPDCFRLFLSCFFLILTKSVRRVNVLEVKFFFRC